ncbi:hypothetical protein Tco_0873398 [Tanacetum coccineum]
MARLWWPQPARPPPQRWRHAGGGVTVVVDLWWKRGRVSWLSEVVRWWRRNGEDGDVDVGCDVACRSVGEDSDDGGLVVKILAGEDGGSPEKSAGKVFRRRRLAGGGWPEIGERGERILSGVCFKFVMNEV